MGVRTDAKGERLITLDVQPDSEARELLTRRIGTRRAKAEPAVVGELADTASRLRALQTGDPVTDVRTVFSWFCQHLGAESARLFRLLGIWPRHHGQRPL